MFDFDGPICKLFALHTAGMVAHDLRSFARAAIRPDPLPVPLDRCTDPLAFAVELHGRVPGLEELLACHERKAAETAWPTPGSQELMERLADRSVPLAVCSNNDAGAVRIHLARRGLLGGVVAADAVIGRGPLSEGRMKPDPAPVVRAASSLGAAPGDCVMIGDSVTDVIAARAAGMDCIGLANRPEKAEPLRRAGAVAVVSAMSEPAVPVPPVGAVRPAPGPR